jgi:hypothetical protein
MVFSEAILSLRRRSGATLQLLSTPYFFLRNQGRGRFLAAFDAYQKKRREAGEVPRQFLHGHEPVPEGGAEAPPDKCLNTNVRKTLDTALAPKSFNAYRRKLMYMFSGLRYQIAK